MFDFPNSSAMDATASSGGPSTFLMQIVTGQPQQIAAHSTGLLQKATQFISLAEEFTKAGEQLSKVWSGQASQSAVQKITSSLQSFQKIIQVIQNGAKLLGISGTLVQSAQAAYKSRNAEVLMRAKTALIGYVAAQAVKEWDDAGFRQQLIEALSGQMPEPWPL